jgi:heparanase 1
MQKLRFQIWVALVALIVALVLPSLNRAQAAAINPKKLPAVGTVDIRYQSYNIEMLEVTGGRFWAPYKTQGTVPADTSQTTPEGMPASLYRYRAPIDLANPRLRKLAAALGPAYIRVSGTWANSTFFADTDEPPPTTPPAGFNGVLTRKQWSGVIDFSHAVNAEIVSSFAISSGVRDADGVWTPVEAKKILAYTKKAGGNIVAAEMFNEPSFASMGGAPKGYDAAAYARDFRAFHSFIVKADPELKVLGPGAIGEASMLGQAPGLHLIKSEDMLKDEGPGLDAFSYHFYGGVSKRCGMMGGAMQSTPETALSDEWLSRTNRDAAFYSSLRDRFASGKQLWLTETGETACGGNPWASTFIDSFRYLNQLGTLARHDVKVVIHNTLAASDYALIDEATLMPRPNYWSALVWRRLMGTTVLGAGATAQPGLYLYAHCLSDHPGGVALLAINADRDHARNLSLPTDSTRYSLTANDLLSSTVLLNGAELKVTADGDLPVLEGAPQHAGDVSLPAASITFFAIPKAHNAACH